MTRGCKGDRCGRASQQGSRPRPNLSTTRASPPRQEKRSALHSDRVIPGERAGAGDVKKNRRPPCDYASAWTLPSLGPHLCLTVRKPLNQHGHVALEAIDGLILCHAVCSSRVRSEHQVGGVGSERRAARSAKAAIGAEPSQRSVAEADGSSKGSRPRGELRLLLSLSPPFLCCVGRHWFPQLRLLMNGCQALSSVDLSLYALRVCESVISPS